jgi:hypothetical protein
VLVDRSGSREMIEERQKLGFFFENNDAIKQDEGQANARGGGRGER